MYWLTNSSIIRASMDGQNVTTLLHLDNPQAITIDYLLSHIYYVDSIGLHVRVNEKSKLVSRSVQSRSITIFEDWIYIYNSEGIRKVNKITGKMYHVQNVSLKINHKFCWILTLK